MELAPAWLSCLFGLQEALGESTHPVSRSGNVPAPRGDPGLVGQPAHVSYLSLLPPVLEILQLC